MRRFLFVTAFLPVIALAQDLRTGEEITVERILIDARVTDYNGDPVTDLELSDFEVRVGGKRATIESVEWIPDTFEARVLAGLNEGKVDPEQPIAPRGRMFIYFVQTDFARNASRVRGHVKFMSFVEKMIESLDEEDRVAVFSFDSHLKFRLDFTSEKRDIIHAMRQAVLTDDPAWPPVVPNPSLSRRLDRETMRGFTTSDEAFIHIANAARHIPGPKSMILFGWGLGQLVAGRVTMDSKYPAARRALEQARVTVFSLDTTDADYHDLEFGLGKAAKDTGGFYAKTHIFPQIAIDRLQRTLAGHYELEVRRPAGLAPGTHEIDVRVKRRGTYVMARSSFMDEKRTEN
jgi:VWFA-related protein